MLHHLPSAADTCSGYFVGLKTKYFLSSFSLCFTCPFHYHHVITRGWFLALFALSASRSIPSVRHTFLIALPFLRVLPHEQWFTSFLASCRPLPSCHPSSLFFLFFSSSSYPPCPSSYNPLFSLPAAARRGGARSGGLHAQQAGAPSRRRPLH